MRKALAVAGTLIISLTACANKSGESAVQLQRESFTCTDNSDDEQSMPVQIDDDAEIAEPRGNNPLADITSAGIEIAGQDLLVAVAVDGDLEDQLDRAEAQPILRIRIEGESPANSFVLSAHIVPGGSWASNWRNQLDQVTTVNETTPSITGGTVTWSTPLENLAQIGNTINWSAEITLAVVGSGGAFSERIHDRCPDGTSDGSQEVFITYSRNN